MGVSFKISSSGTRFKPKPALVSEVVAETLAETSKITSKNGSNNSTSNTVASCSKFDGRDEDSVRFSDSSLSFRRHQSLSDQEVSFTLNLFHDGYSIGKPLEDIGHHASVQDPPKLLLPYGRASEPLFLAIESGWLPGDILNDIPCKYVDGGLICQVRDFRKCTSNSGSTTDVSPITTKVHLRMSLENIVKDISSFADDSWTYGDLMEVESRVLKALQPKLCLDPTPRRLSQDPVSSKLNLGLSGLRTKRMREMPDRLDGKRMQDSISGQNIMTSRSTQDSSLTSTVLPIASPGAQDMTISYNDSVNSNTLLPHGKLEPQDGQLSPYSAKRARLGSVPDTIMHHHPQQLDVQWKNHLLQQQQQANVGQEGMRYGDQIEAGDVKLDKSQQRPLSQQQVFMRPNFHQKEENSQKRKGCSSQSPRVSSTIVPQSPLSGKSTELAGGFQYGALSSSSSMQQQQQQQQQAAGKRRSNSLPKTAIGSPASITNVCIPMNAPSPSAIVPDHSMLDKFSKIEMVAARFKLNCKRTKTDELSRKHRAFSPQEVSICLSTIANDENIKDDSSTMPMSKSLVGGSINALKIRVMSFKLPDRTVTGNTPVAARARARLIMSEKPLDGTVAMHFGEMEDRDYLNEEDNLPYLPTTHFADLLASQFSVLMVREGYYLDDHVQSRLAAGGASAPAVQRSVNESQQYGEVSSGVQMHETKPIINPNAAAAAAAINSGSCNNLVASAAMLSGGSRPPQIDPQHQMMHQPQFSRSVLLPPAASLPNALGNNSTQMVNKASSLQMLQQQQQQQQQPTSQAQMQSQMQRKMMGLGSGPNNLVGLGGIGNVMGMGGPRGGMGNMGQNGLASNFTNAISQQLRSGTLTHMQAQAILASRMRITQNRGMIGGPQSGMTAGGAAVRQMQPSGLSMLTQTLQHRGGNSTNPMRPSMAAPRLMTGMNVHMNQQQQQMLQIQQMQQFQQQQQHQPIADPLPQMHQQQQEASPLQSVISAQQVSSPVGLIHHHHQQPSPQMSSAAINPTSAGNPDPGPASPQLSSQTLGSVGSISNSPMDLQGVNKKTTS